MISKNDEQWLKNLLVDCFGDEAYLDKDVKTLASFKILVGNIVISLEKKLDEARALCEKEPRKGQLKERLDTLARHLFYLQRFCQ